MQVDIIESEHKIYKIISPKKSCHKIQQDLTVNRFDLMRNKRCETFKHIQRVNISTRQKERLKQAKIRQTVKVSFLWVVSLLVSPVVCLCMLLFPDVLRQGEYKEYWLTFDCIFWTLSTVPTSKLE